MPTILPLFENRDNRKLPICILKSQKFEKLYKISKKKTDTFTWAIYPSESFSSWGSNLLPPDEKVRSFTLDPMC